MGSTPTHFAHVLLANGAHWKDPGVNLAHGEYTHRIQWWVVINAKIKLTHKPANLFRKLGGPECFFPNKGNDEPRSLFFWLFDTKDGANALAPTIQASHKERPDQPYTDDFRCPENFNRWMVNSPLASSKFPILSQFLADRYYKRRNMAFKNAKGYEAVIAKLKLDFGDGVMGSKIAWKP